MRIYIAACFGQQAEVREKADQLTQAKHVCTSNWRYEKPSGDGSEAKHASKYLQAAMQDLRDIDSSDLLVLLAGQVSTTGGKHFEVGYAVAKGKQVVVVGAPENVFHWTLPRFATWQEFMETLP
jgi:nucleoside 2-deoxyribosyltransferase